MRHQAGDLRRFRLLHYGVAVLTVAAALLLQLALQPLMERESFLLFFVAVVIVAWYGGQGPGLLATILAALVIKFIEPDYWLEWDLASITKLGIFIVAGLLISLLSASRKRAAESLRQARDELERQVQERTAELARANEAWQLEIAERKRLEEQLLQAQKMETIGRLAGGIAHDFNNLLTAIIGYSSILLRHCSQDHPLRAEIEEIEKAGQRAAALTSQLLSFSRKQVLQPRVVDLNSVVTNLERMLRRLIGEDVELVTVLKPELGRVRVDPGQIEQVIMNLAVNARDAMPAGGKLTIETDNVELDEHYAREHVSVRPGPYVMLAVSDTGCGMDKETQAHIFEPFFTTKERGKGTGLGLATVYGIVKQSGGNIWVYSEPGQGTTFKLYFPCVAGQAEMLTQKTESVSQLRGTETILLVEDDQQVQSLAARVLREQGYKVLETSNGKEALHLAAHYLAEIHLVLTDVVMPGMSGRVLVDHLKSLRPELRVLYLSGYTDDTIVHHRVLDPGASFLQKPFTPQGLARKVREVLGEAKRASSRCP